MKSNRRKGAIGCECLLRTPKLPSSCLPCRRGEQTSTSFTRTACSPGFTHSESRERKRGSHGYKSIFTMSWHNTANRVEYECYTHPQNKNTFINYIQCAQLTFPCTSLSIYLSTIPLGTPCRSRVLFLVICCNPVWL